MTAVLGVPSALAWTRAGGVDDGVLDAAFRARRFARHHLRPAALELDARMDRDHDYFPWDLVRAGAREGWLSAAIPTGWGGGGLGITAMAASIEEMCAADAGMANIFGAHGLGLLPIMLSMDIGLSEKILTHVARAERQRRPVICAFAITEPGGGSDVEEQDGLTRGDVRSYAVKVPGGYRITGRKVFISNGNVADYVVVYAALDRSDPASSWSAFVVERGARGFECARTERKMGQRACPAAELSFDEVFVPTGMRVGEEGDGWRATRRVLAVSRGPVGAIATGIARDAYEAALEYVRSSRNGAAKPLETWRDDLLAAMVVRIRTARAAYLEAVVHTDQVIMPGKGMQTVAAVVGRIPAGRALLRSLTGGLDRGREEAWAHQGLLGATAKVAASDAAMMVTTAALDIIPPTAGLLRARAEKAFRDAKLTQIYEGTNQINLRAIAHESWQRSASDRS